MLPHVVSAFFDMIYSATLLLATYAAPLRAMPRLPATASHAMLRRPYFRDNAAVRHPLRYASALAAAYMPCRCYEPVRVTY